MPQVAIIDYRLCNLDSIRRATEICGGSPVVTDDPDALRDADMLILPGVGAFGVAMANLCARGMDEAIRDRVSAGVPLFGICLGMQLLASRSSEGGSFDGLGLIPATVELLQERDGRARIPHIGWNSVHIERDDPLFEGVPTGTDFYFVHSYRMACGDPGAAIATTPYCGRFTAAVRRDNIVGTQFHPEKSQRAGQRMLSNFLRQ